MNSNHLTWIFFLSNGLEYVIYFLSEITNLWAFKYIPNIPTVTLLNCLFINIWFIKKDRPEVIKPLSRFRLV